MISANYKCAIVVDDDPILVELAQSLLRKLGIERIHSASDGGEAMDILARHKDEIGLVLCDLQMPKMDGVAFLRELGALAFKGDVVVVSSMNDPVLALTGQLAKSHGLTVRGTLKKPLNAAKLRSLLARREAVGPVAQIQNAGTEISTAQLRSAIEHGEIVAHYQPKLETASGQLVGAEALARWRLGDGTFVPPAHFVPLAEKAGVIAALDCCILRNVITDLPKLRAVDPSFCVSVNASADTLSDLGMFDMLTGLMAAAQLDHSAVALEITERQALRKSPALMEVLARLRVAGFELAIDDFGTGHSNLETLREFPFTEIKIDQSFVREAPSCKRASAAVEACVMLGRELGLNIVAEGVEADEHWQMLRNAGARMAQGYFIARPMPLDGLLEWMRFRGPPPSAKLHLPAA